MNTISELSPSEIRTLGRLEKRIEQRPQGGIGVGLDLLKIEDRQLYRDFQNFETYRAAKLPEIKSSTGYHLRSIARLWSRMKRNITPEGATELLAWDAFRRHRNVSTIDALSKIRTTAKQWQLYVLAFQVAGGVEPSPAHVREVARHLEIPVKRSVSEKLENTPFGYC